VAALALTSGALADRRTVADVVDERAAPLDIASIGHGHDARGRLVHTVRMRESWRLRALRPGRGELALLFDLDGELINGHPQFERAVVIWTSGGRLRAEMRGRRNQVLGRVNVWRPNDRTVKVAFRQALLRRRLAEYHWFASTLVYEGEHVRGGDDAPGERTSSIPETLTHQLRSGLTG
jgi:hypothetical protein